MLINSKTIWKERRKELRQRSTPAESVLWRFLKAKALGEKAYRQFSIGNYIVDFCFPRAKLVIEIDGGIHEDPDHKECDKKRTVFLEAVNFKVIRFSNQQVLENTESIIGEIKVHLKNSARPLFTKEGEGGRYY